MLIKKINQLLSSRNKRRTAIPDYIPCGSTGDRIFADFADKPGLTGRFHFIHITNIPDILAPKFEYVNYFPRLKMEYCWFPTHVHFRHVYALFDIEEDRYITQDDVAVSEMTIIARSGPCCFKLSFTSEILDSQFRIERNVHGQDMVIEAYCSCPEMLDGFREISLKKGEIFNVSITASFRLKHEITNTRIPRLEQHIMEYGLFFENVPYIECSNKYVEKAYWYRWFLIKYHIANPHTGNILNKCFYESRYGIIESEKEWSTGEGWEFSRAILCSCAHHVLEATWLNDPGIVKEEIKNYTDNLGRGPAVHPSYPGNLLPGCIRVHDFKGHYFFHCIPYALWVYYCKAGDIEFVQEVIELLWKDLSAWEQFGEGNPDMPLVHIDGDTWEFAPSAHYDYSQGKKWQKRDIPNRRTESNAFYAANMLSMGKLFEAIGDLRSVVCFEKYEKIKDAIKNLSWDDSEKFFLELDTDNRKLLGIKQVGGLFTLLEIDPPDAEGFFANLSDAGKFGMPYGIPSASADSFGYYPNNTADGKRPHMCMWNGPVWPFASSYALTAMGAFLKRNPNKKYINLFQENFFKYTMLHFIDSDYENCCIREHYNPETGESLSAEDDYNHSSYIDILIRMVAGFDFDSKGRLNFSPLGIGKKWLKVENIFYKGDFYSCEINGISGTAKLLKNGILFEQKKI